MDGENEMAAPVAFLSHSWEDSKPATELATDLRSQGVDVWLDKWEIRPGDSLRRKIDEGIEKASLFLVLLTPSSLSSEWVQVELDAGMVKRILGQCRLIPILLGTRDEQVPPTLSGISWVRLDDYQDGLKRLIEVCHGIETKPPLGPTPKWDTSLSGGISEPALPDEAFGSSTYAQSVGHMQLANRDGQLVGVVADLGHAATRFESGDKLALAGVLPKYLDARDFKPPLLSEDYVQFEFLPTLDGRRIWLEAKREGVLTIEVWRLWPPGVPWDWLLAEAYSSLLFLRDERLTGLFQSRGVVRATFTLGNLLGLGGTASDVGVTTRGLRLDLLPEDAVTGDRMRFPSVKYECGTPMSSDPWECAKAFVEKALTNTGVMLFEKALKAVNEENFLGLYFEDPRAFRRPQPH